MKTPKFLLSALLIAGLASCQKDDTQADTSPEKPEAETTDDIAMTMSIDDEITNLGQMSMEGNPSKKTTSWLSCITYTIDTTGSTTEVTLDFGATNCLGSDGKNRRGKLIVTLEDNPFDAGSVTSVTSNGYTVNDHLVMGSKSMTFQGLNTDGDPYLDINTALSIVNTNQDTITWNSTQTRVWTDGFGNLNPHDNAVEITGVADGKTASGIDYDITIIDPLRVEAGCHYIVSGSFNLTSPLFPDRLFDYGNGVCDRVATVTISGYTFTFLM
ncbi:hypothetical protein [Owenweeksia hongkongensis]|uniref:hypothetical protein n=1 Tax=Owenweeksia hongkongensis TaxID=253245 RepID=UPI003A93342C